MAKNDQITRVFWSKSKKKKELKTHGRYLFSIRQFILKQLKKGEKKKQYSRFRILTTIETHYKCNSTEYRIRSISFIISYYRILRQFIVYLEFFFSLFPNSLSTRFRDGIKRRYF